MKRCSSDTDQGMTMLEMMLAVLLFAVFMGVFLAVTELTAQLLRGVEGGRPASDLALARTLTRQQLTALGSELSSVDAAEADLTNNFVGASNCLLDANSTLATGRGTWTLPTRTANGLEQQQQWTIQQKQLARLDQPAAMPGSVERICLYPTAYQEQAGQPGLYVLQAEPLQSGPLSQPVRLLLCRPDYLCR